MLPEPNRTWQYRTYQRLLRNDPTAFAELCERVLPHLVLFLQSQFPQQDQHRLEMAAIDVMLAFRADPEKYDVKKLSVVAYLRMAARKDVLNLLDKTHRREQRLTDIEGLNIATEENPVEAHFALDEWLEQHTELSLKEIFAALEREIDPDDIAVLMLMAEGVRETERYAEVMGVGHLGEETQRQVVKKAKDRLIKQLQRFGERIRKDKS